MINPFNTYLLKGGARMGWKLKRIDIKLCEHEEKDLTLILQPEKRAAIHGVVKLPNGTPVKNAIVKLFKKDKCNSNCDLTPITFTFTDECGQFLFGVDAGVEYVVKIFFYTPETKKCDRKNACDC